MKSYLVTLVGGFLGLIVAKYLQIEFKIPFLITFLVYCIILFSIIKIFFRDTHTNNINNIDLKDIDISIFGSYENQQKKQNNKTKAIDFILKYYKHIYFGIILLIIFFPPHYTNYKYIKYEFIIGSMYPIHFSTFFAEIVGILVIGLAFYFLFIKNKNNNVPRQ
ncbi:hypothetical protein [Aliarcobacter butzleri]|nr:hypothetical protein [Aliarcobacter butzleri]